MLEILEDLFNEKKNRSGSDIAGHLPYLLELVEAIKPKVIVHAGIRDGHSGAAFALGAYKVGAELVDVDMADYQNVVSKYNFQELREKCSFWAFKQGTTEAVFPQLSELLGKVDIFFTDTSHNYEDTKFEFDNYATLLTPTGVIITHDMYLIESIENGYIYELSDNKVKKFNGTFNEYCNNIIIN